MRNRLLISGTGFGLLALAQACGGPDLDDFEHDSAPPEPGGASAVAIGSHARGGSAGRPASNRGGTNPKGDGGTTLAASGGAATSPPPTTPEAGASSGGVPASRGGAASIPAQGGRGAATGGRVSSSAGVANAGGAAGSDDPASGGAPSAAGGVLNDPQGGTPSQAGVGQAGMQPGPETSGGTPSSGGEASGGAPVVTEPPERTLWFSEYVEGSGNLKALELASLSEQSTSGCQIEVFANGEFDSPNVWKLETTLGPVTPLVVCTEELSVLLGDLCLQLNLSFNGDDAVVLRCDGVTVDVIGQVGFRPDKQWGEGELRTLNMTLRRACHISAGDPNDGDAFDPALEWEAVATDDFAGLGTHCNGTP